jgi:hypothetical protein
MEESAREGLLVDGAGTPLAEEDSGSVELLDGTRVAYHAIAPENASALQRFHHRLSERSIYLRFFAAKPELSDRKAGYFTNVWASRYRTGALCGLFACVLVESKSYSFLKPLVPVVVVVA